MPKPYNNHHVMFEKRWYKTPIEKTLRGHRGLIVPMWLEAHRELHADLAPAPKPSRDSMLGALALLDDMSSHDLSQHQDMVVERLGEYMVAQGEAMGAHLLSQAVYIEEGLYR